jgi:hypothetical protein
VPALAHAIVRHYSEGARVAIPVSR